jgi:hypothetical protein
MLTTIQNLIKSLFPVLGEKEKPVAKEDNAIKECCKIAINKAIKNKEHQDIFANSPNKTIIVSAYCEVCNSTLNIAVKCKQTNNS